MIVAKKLWLMVGGVATATAITAVVARKDPPADPSPASTPATKPAPIDPGLPELVVQYPTGDNAACGIAEDRVDDLLRIFEELLPADLRARLAEQVREQEATRTTAMAWNDVGILHYLMGDACAAAWCGLHAVRIEWSADFVTNCGIFLFAADELDDALAFLNCAYALGSRSPYLFEALSAVYRARNDETRAREYILLASARAGGDPAIRAARQLAGAVDPSDPGAADPSPADPLDEAFLELRDHIARLLGLLDEMTARVDHVEDDPEKKMWRDQTLAITRKWWRDHLRLTADAIGRARLTREEYARMAGHADGAAGFEAGYLQAARVNRNMAFVACMTHLIEETHMWLIMLGGYPGFDGDGYEVIFWAEALGMDARALAEAMRLSWDSSATPERIRRDDEFDRDQLTNSYWCEHAEAEHEARARHSDEFDACNRFDPGPTRDACMAQAEAAWCERRTVAFGVLSSKATERMNRAAARFDSTAMSRLDAGAEEVLRVRDYIRKYLPHVRANDNVLGHDASGAPIRERQVYEDMLGKLYRERLVAALIDPQQSSSIAEWLGIQARDFDGELTELRRRLDLERQDIGLSIHGCPEPPAPRFDALRQEAWQRYLAELAARLAVDFEATEVVRSDCIVHLLFCDFDADAAGQFLRRSDCLEEHRCFERGSVAAIALRTGAGAPSGTDPTLFVGVDAATGAWGRGFTLMSPAGHAAEQRRRVFGREYVVALPCYAEGVSPRMIPRAVADGVAESLATELTRGR